MFSQLEVMEEESKWQSMGLEGDNDTVEKTALVRKDSDVMVRLHWSLVGDAEAKINFSVLSNLLA